MALSETEKIYQAAADMIGEIEITTSSDTSIKPYSVCARHYEQARDEILRGYAWNEAVDYALCLESTVKPAHTWTYKFILPSDCLKPVTTTRPKEDWRGAGNYVYTNYKIAPDTYDSDGTDYYAGQFLSKDDTTYLINSSFTSSAWATDAYNCTSQGADLGYLELVYVKQLTDPTDWSAQLREAIILNLALKIVISLTGDYQRRTSLLEELHRVVLPKAQALDAMQGKPKQFFYSEYIDARDEI